MVDRSVDTTNSDTNRVKDGKPMLTHKKRDSKGESAMEMLMMMMVMMVVMGG